MKHKFEDILILYIGCKVEITKKNGCITGCEDGLNTLTGSMLDLYPKYIEVIKPYLRLLSDQSEQEALSLLRLNNEKFSVIFEFINKKEIHFRYRYPRRKSKIYKQPFPVVPKTANAVLKAAKMGFDLFNLIEENLAIEFNNIKQE